MKQIAFFTGSFDPITNGHLDIIERASNLFDEVVVGVFDNVNKNYWWNSLQRAQMVKESVSHLSNIKVKSFPNILVIEAAKNIGATCIIKGLRNTIDYEYEKNAQKFNLQEGRIETLCLLSKDDHEIVSSSFVKELAMLNGPYEKYVPVVVKEEIKNKVREKYEEKTNCK